MIWNPKMRMSQPQIDALRLMMRDPNAKIRANILQALRHRGLADRAGRLTALGRRAEARLRQEEPEQNETRIHLENEPATLAQLRVLSRILKFEPDNLSKEDASQLISFLKDLGKSETAFEARISSVGLLLRTGAQAIDVIGFSDRTPVQTAAGTAMPALIDAGTKKEKPVVTPALTLADGETIVGAPITLRPRGDVPSKTSRAREVFQHIAGTIKRSKTDVA